MPDIPKSAIWYARHGWEVFPCWPKSKTPMTKRGVLDATSDVDQVMDWWRRTPNANIGLHCGGSGLLAIDLDEYKDSYNGHSLISFAEQETLSSITGNGGHHLIYTMPEGAKYGNATGNLPDGIDVRGWAGYLILPPSIHPDTGRRYQWETGYSPAEIEPLPLPDKLQAILGAVRVRQCGAPSSAAVAEGIKGVEKLIDLLGLDTHPPMNYDNGGRKWILKQCPFQPADDPHTMDRGTFLLVAKDGHTAAGCQHSRCQHKLKTLNQSGWTYLWNMVYGRVAA